MKYTLILFVLLSCRQGYAQKLLSDSIIKGGFALTNGNVFTIIKRDMEVSKDGKLVAEIDSNHVLHVYDSLATIQVLLLEYKIPIPYTLPERTKWTDATQAHRDTMIITKPKRQ